MDDYHVLIQIKNERDFIHGWAREGRVMEGNSFSLFKRTKDFDLRKEFPHGSPMDLPSRSAIAPLSS